MEGANEPTELRQNPLSLLNNTKNYDGSNFKLALPKYVASAKKRIRPLTKEIYLTSIDGAAKLYEVIICMLEV